MPIQFTEEELYKIYNKIYNKIKINCPHCNKEMLKTNIKRHLKVCKGV